ncbi:MAG: penicillin acylase family protein, partial [Myxococcota bacterium]|nr:penicillin acylase family protein [Myxococcota bacterium]
MSLTENTNHALWISAPWVAVLLLLFCLTSGCRQPIEILLEADGTAHVYARTDADAWYGAGYQTASDRMLQMEMLRRFALGRLSEVLGEEGLARDEQALIFDLRRWGKLNREATAEVDPERAMLVEAWREGVNRRIEEVRSGEAPLPWGYASDQLDFLPEPWDEEDPYIVLVGANFAIDRTLEFEIAMTLVESIYPAVVETTDLFRPAHDVFALPPEDRPETFASGAGEGEDRQRKFRVDRAGAASRFAGLEPSVRDRLLDWRRPRGSNNWAMDGRHTASGRPLVAGDPHMGFDFYGGAYPLHVDSKSGRGSYATAGFAFPGTPGIALGQNDRTVWTATSAFGDNMDLWEVERVDGGIRLGDEVLPLEIRTESILVRDAGAPAGEGRLEVRDYEEVPGHGVLLPEDYLPLPMGDFLVNWVGFQPRPARWFMELNRVEDLDSFEASVDRMVEMNYSFVAATADGISYRVGVEVPDRPHFDG